MSNDEVIIQPRLREWARDFFADKGTRPAARAIGVSASRINDLLKHNDKYIGEDVLRKIAWWARIPEHEIFEMGELLPRTPDLTSDTRFIIWVYEQLDDTAREDMLKFAEHLRDRSIKSHPLRPGR